MPSIATLPHAYLVIIRHRGSSPRIYCSCLLCDNCCASHLARLQLFVCSTLIIHHLACAPVHSDSAFTCHLLAKVLFLLQSSCCSVSAMHSLHTGSGSGSVWRLGFRHYWPSWFHKWTAKSLSSSSQLSCCQTFLVS